MFVSLSIFCQCTKNYESLHLAFRNGLCDSFKFGMLVGIFTANLVYKTCTFVVKILK